MRVRQFRLVSPELSVDVRIVSIDGRWLASADTSDGPSLGIGRLPEEAIRRALRPFDDSVDELMASVPGAFYWSRL
jgi:hypothetical protein